VDVRGITDGHTDTHRNTQFYVTHINKKKNLDRHFLKRVEFFVAGVEAQGDKNGGRILLGDNRRRGGHVTVYLSSDFSGRSCKCTCVAEH
jgi:hypothetical protein